MLGPLHFAVGEFVISDKAKENRGVIKSLFSKEYFSTVKHSAGRLATSVKQLSAQTPQRSKAKKILDCSKNLLDLAIRVMPYVCVIASVGCIIGAGFAGPAAPALLAAAPILIASGRAIQKYVEARDRKAFCEAQCDSTLNAFEAHKSNHQRQLLNLSLDRKTASLKKVAKHDRLGKEKLENAIETLSQDIHNLGPKPVPDVGERSNAAFDVMLMKDREIAALKQHLAKASTYDPEAASPRLEKLVRAKYAPLLRLLVESSTEKTHRHSEKSEYQASLDRKVQSEVQQLQHEIAMERTRKANEKHTVTKLTKKALEVALPLLQEGLE